MVSRRDLLHALPMLGSVLLAARRQPFGQQIATRRQSRERCPATVQELLNLAATVEALTTTFYYGAITTPEGFFAGLPTSYQRYLRLALDAEWFHYRHLVEQQGATPVQTAFHFPVDSFAVGRFSNFLATLDLLEVATLACYLATSRRLGELNELALAALFGQMAGIEAEHRVMGREMAQNSPPAPNNLCYERADFVCATEVNQVWVRYFNGGAGFIGPVALPDQTQVISAVNGVTCEAVSPLAVMTCPESLTDILNAAATAEALVLPSTITLSKAAFSRNLAPPSSGICRPH
ncbi:MAG: ferritin-like domain-containing protein [Caldilineaceae bacterium]